MFKPVDAQANFPQLEEKILEFWQENRIFEKSLDRTKNGERFVFYEGPPTANGKPHIGHVLARSFKDLFPRFKTMRGFYVLRKAGWDSHGLPVELEVEKELGISGKKQIEKFGIEKFNKLCRESVFRYIDVWERMTKRMGFWIDLSDPYVVLDKDYIESLWWILKQAWDKKLLVRDYKVTPYCPRCQTPISSHELAQGYKDNVEDPSIYIKFSISDNNSFYRERFPGNVEGKAYLIAWTTTPWTLLGNVALAVDPDADYVAVKTVGGGEILILAKDRLDVLGGEGEVLATFQGQELVDLEYEPLYNFVDYDKKAHYVVPADFVDLSEGTGIVHTAVMYGEEDFALGQKFDLPKKHVVNGEGKFVGEIKPFAGEDVWKATEAIISDLKGKKALYKSETIHHTYPYCWRCKTKLIYYALESWFIKTTAVKERLLRNNSQVDWYPAHIKEGRMGDWLRNVKDWSTSR
jgi:isoleucyl-tRNA synthetase